MSHWCSNLPVVRGMFFTISISTYFSVHPGLEKPLLNRISPPSTSMTGPWTDIIYGWTRVSLSTSFYTDFISVDLRTLEVECLLRLSLYSSGTIELLKMMYIFLCFFLSTCECQMSTWPGGRAADRGGSRHQTPHCASSHRTGRPAQQTHQLILHYHQLISPTD